MEIKSLFKRLTMVGAFWGVLHVIDTVYDYMLYPAAIAYFGTLIGGTIMTIGSAALCLIFLVIYEKSGEDWMGVNILEEIKENGESWVEKLKTGRSTFFGRIKYATLFIPAHTFLICVWAMKKGDWAAFIALSILQDPFKTTVYLRHGRFDGLKRKDWIVFWSSVLLSNFWWISLSSLVVGFGKFIWEITL